MRCRCCDATMKPEEIIWVQDRRVHEDLCRYCRKDVQSTLASDLDAGLSTLSYSEEEESFDELDDRYDYES